jgi:hypothetical protein
MHVMFAAAAVVVVAPGQLPPPSRPSIPTLVRGWASGSSQGAWCGESCLLDNAATLLSPNMSLEIDPFMQRTESVWPTVVAEGWWRPDSGGDVAVDTHGRAAPAPARFPHANDTTTGGGLTTLCAALFALRGAANHAQGLRCGADLVLAVPRAAVDTATPVLGAPAHVTAATVANQSDPIGEHHFALNSSAAGASQYAQSLARMLRGWGVVHVRVVGGAQAERWLPALRAFVAAFNRTVAHPGSVDPQERTLAIGSEPSGVPEVVAVAHQAGAWKQPPPPAETGLLRSLLSLANSVAPGPPLWDTWPHLATALRSVVEFWRGQNETTLPDYCGVRLCARWDVGALPIGRLGARADSGNASYPPWPNGSCSPAQLGCGNASDAAKSPACCPRQSRLSEAEARFVYALALATNSPLVLGGSMLGLSSSLPSMRRFMLPDHGAFAYSRSPFTDRAQVLPPLAAPWQNGSVVIVCRGRSGTSQPRVYDYEWMCWFFNTGTTSLQLRFALSDLPLGAGAIGNATGRDYMLNSLLPGDGEAHEIGPSGAYFGGRLLQIGGDAVNGSSAPPPQLVSHDAFAVHICRVRQGANITNS